MPYIGNFFFAIAIPLSVAILFIKNKARRFCIFFIVGMFICLICAYLNSFFQQFFGMNANDAAIYITPLCEEVMKLLPILFFMVVFEPDNEDIIITALTVGIGFATLENCCYLLELVEEEFKFTLIRGLAVGVMHTVCAVTVGLGLTVFKRYKEIGVVGAIGIFATAFSYHAIYNLLVSGGEAWRITGYCMPIVTIILVYFLYRHGMFRLDPKEVTTNDLRGNKHD